MNTKLPGTISDTTPDTTDGTSLTLHHIALLPSDGALRIDDLLRAHGVTPPLTPGNVGLCLSGGGSRALCAGMGQMRGLQALSRNGRSLLSQIKAISTVSGGSWVGQTWSYLANPAIPDSAYLGPYLPPATITATDLAALPAGNLGNVCNNIRFSSPGVLVEAILLMKVHGVSPHLVWQVALGQQLLAPYGLYQSNAFNAMPASWFSFNAASQAAIVAKNPALPATCYFPADNANPGRGPRPFPICNMSMIVSVNGEQFAAPLQSTPYFTGVLGTPGLHGVPALDSNQQVVGGGAISSFAFNSRLHSSLPPGHGTVATATQARSWTVMDMVGTSSAAIGAALWTVAEHFRENPGPLRSALENLYRHHPEHFDLLSKAPATSATASTTPAITGNHSSLLQRAEDVIHHVAEVVESAVKQVVGKVLHDVVHATESALSEAEQLIIEPVWHEIEKFLADLPNPAHLIPQYQYWSPQHGQTIGANAKANDYADGGLLENTGLGGMLAYEDIDALIVFINSETAMVACECGIFDGTANNSWLPGTNVKVDSQVPPLFGYTYDDKKKGYVPLTLNNAGGNPMVNSQLFPAAAFADLLRLWWQAANTGGSNHAPATCLLTLQTVDNPWFGVKAGRQVKVLWSYLNPVQSWYEQLSAAVQPKVKNTYPEWAKVFESKNMPAFPNYSTVFQTELSPSQVVLMSNLTAWCVADDANSAAYLSLFE
ncbi:MAG: hypothetical protein RL748_3451 [Pseudomonadota bacterium]